MGRIFEVRKHAMFARWNRMAKQFARIGKEITIAVKSGGPDPDSNPTLRRCIQNARAVNMPKDKIEAAIKRASGRDAANFEEVMYEGYGPHGVAVLVECATDNPTRTVASVRNAFSKNGGNLATTGSVSFQFKRMGVFRLNPEGLDADRHLNRLAGGGDFHLPLQPVGGAHRDGAHDAVPELLLHFQRERGAVHFQGVVNTGHLVARELHVHHGADTLNNLALSLSHD
jgi:hypothetical protein